MLSETYTQKIESFFYTIKNENMPMLERRELIKKELNSLIDEVSANNYKRGLNAATKSIQELLNQVK